MRGRRPVFRPRRGIQPPGRAGDAAGAAAERDSRQPAQADAIYQPAVDHRHRQRQRQHDGRLRQHASDALPEPLQHHPGQHQRRAGSPGHRHRRRHRQHEWRSDLYRAGARHPGVLPGHSDAGAAPDHRLLRAAGLSAAVADGSVRRKDRGDLHRQPDLRPVHLLQRRAQRTADRPAQGSLRLSVGIRTEHRAGQQQRALRAADFVRPRAAECLGHRKDGRGLFKSFRSGIGHPLGWP